MSGRQPRPAWAALVGSVLVPLVFVSGMLGALSAAGQPGTALRAAIVNLDWGVVVDGQSRPIGRQLAAALTSADSRNLVWTEVDRATAQAGLADGTFVTAVFIPESFSADVTSTSGDPLHARQAKIDIATSPKAGVNDVAIGHEVAKAASESVGKEVTKGYLDKVFLDFSSNGAGLDDAAGRAAALARQAGDAASSIKAAEQQARQLATDTIRARDDAQQIAAAQLASAQRVTALAEQAAAAAGVVDDGAQTLTSDAGTLVTDAGRLAVDAGRSKTGADSLLTGNDQLAGSAQDAGKAADQHAADAAGVLASVEDLRKALGDADALAATVGTSYDAANRSLTTHLEAVDEVLAALADQPPAAEQPPAGTSDAALRAGIRQAVTSLRAHAEAIIQTQEVDNALTSLDTSAEALTTLRAALIPLREAVSAPGGTTYTSVDDCRTRAKESQQWCLGYLAAQGLQASVTLPQVDAMIAQLDRALTASNAAITSLGTFAGQRDQLAAAATAMADRLEALLATPTPTPAVSPEIVQRLRDSTAAVRGAFTDASASITALTGAVGAIAKDSPGLVDAARANRDAAARAAASIETLGTGVRATSTGLNALVDQLDALAATSTGLGSQAASLSGETARVALQARAVGEVVAQLKTPGTPASGQALATALTAGHNRAAALSSSLGAQAGGLEATRKGASDLAQAVKTQAVAVPAFLGNSDTQEAVTAALAQPITVASPADPSAGGGQNPGGQPAPRTNPNHAAIAAILAATAAVGALVAWSTRSVLPKRARRSTRPLVVNLAFTTAPVLIAALVTGLGSGLVANGFGQLPVGTLPAVLGLLALAGVAVTTAGFALVAWAGPAGRLALVLFGVAAGAAALTRALPAPLDVIAAVSPLTPVFNGLDELLTGGSAWLQAGQLALWLAAAAAMGALALYRARELPDPAPARALD